ncbi:MAG TPA: hypothetical protein VE439_08515 [Anaerolineae bacterium]|jgi:hypothetical protein|nr:hypothetical protein [Anaerolineae bacterium]
MKKFLILFLVALLVMPATALAVGKPDFAASKSAASKSKGKALGTIYSEDNTGTAMKGAHDNTQTSGGSEQASNNSHAKGEQAKALKGANRADQAKENENKALKAKNTLHAADTDTATTAKHRGKGIATAKEKIERNIDRMSEKASTALDKVSTALQAVVDKFTAWLDSIDGAEKTN